LTVAATAFNPAPQAAAFKKRTLRYKLNHWEGNMRWYQRLFRRARTERQLDAELRFHLEQQIADCIAAGMTPEDARRRARLEFGGLDEVKEECRDVGVARTAETLLQDLGYGLRQLRRNPGFTAVAVLTLALGIGATTAMFSIVECVLLRPLPFPHSERLVTLGDILEGAHVGANDGGGVTAPDILAYTRYTHSFQNLGGYQQVDYELSGVGEPAQVNAARLSAGVFPALEVAPLMGRFFTQQEADHRESVAIVSYSFWQSRLHGNPRVLGAKLLLDRKPYEVIGVMPRNFEFPLVPGRLDESELWVPLSFNQQELTTGASDWAYNMVGRLKRGITASQAESDAEMGALEIMRRYPASMASLHIRAVVRSLKKETVEDARQPVEILFLATVVVLLIACANFAGLLLVRAIRRRREIALRLALGARGGVLVRHAVLESVVLSVCGGVLGLGLAAGALRVGASRLPESLPRVDEIGLDWQIALFAIALAVLTGVLCGLAPAFAASRTKVNEALKEGGPTVTSGSGEGRLRAALVVGEIAIAQVLLVASGLFLGSFEKMRAVDVGFRPDHLLTASYSLPKIRYATQVTVNEFNQELVRRLKQTPGIKPVGLTTVLPDSGGFPLTSFVVQGYVPPKGAGMDFASFAAIQANYLQTMGIRLLRGRFFNRAYGENSRLVVIVNKELAEHYWPRSNPLGNRLRFGTRTMKTRWMTIVGEVARVKQSSPDEPTKEQFYQPVEQVQESLGSLASRGALTGNAGYIVVRTAIPPSQMAPMLRATARSLDPQLPLDEVQTMERLLSESEAPRRFNTALVSVFAMVAALLAALGIYSVIAFSSALREHEMAVRLALGSQRQDILLLVLTSATKFAIIGSGLGLVGATAASGILKTFLFGVSALDPAVLALAVILVLILASVASLLPAWRAANVDPMVAVRHE
jgi:putative ABC transport system permease protein